MRPSCGDYMRVLTVMLVKCWQLNVDAQHGHTWHVFGSFKLRELPHVPPSQSLPMELNAMLKCDAC